MRAAVIIFLLCTAHITWAQEKSVPAKEKFRLFQNKLNKLSKPDTVKLPVIPDSVRVASTDTIKRPPVFAGLKHKADSLKTPDFKPDSLTSGFKKPNLALDSLGINTVPAFNDLPSDSIEGKVAAVSDRITTRTARVQEKLKSKTDSLQVPGQVKGLREKLTNKVSTDKINNPNLSVVNPTIPSANQQSGVNIPDLSGGGLKIPEVNSKTDALAIPDTDNVKGIPGLPHVKLPDQQIKLPEAEIPSLDVEGKVKDSVKDKLDLPADLPELKKPDSAQVNELKAKALEDERLKKYAQPVTEVSGKIDPYKKNLDSLTVKDAGTIAVQEGEALLNNTEAMKTLNGYNDQSKAALKPPDAAMLQRYQDKRILKEEMLRKSKSVMNDKLSSLSPQVKDQQQKLGKAKKLNSSVPSVKNMKEKRSEPLKERPLYERIVPGISLQSHKSDVFAIDFAPQVSWRFTTPLSAGAGLFYRVGFDKNYDYFVKGQGVHGFRTFADYRLIKGLFVHAEYEKTFTTEAFAFADPVTPSTYNSMYIGLGKRYPLSRKIYGGLIALYKIEMKDHLAGTSKFNLRVVFEYKTKKVRKPTDI